MLGGDLSLFRNPTEPKHAVTKEYLDDAIAGVGGGTPLLPPYAPMRVGGWFDSQYHNTSSSTTTGPTTGTGRLSPIFLAEAMSFDAIGSFCGLSTSDRGVRYAIYLLDGQLMPTALVLNAGAVSTATGAAIGQEFRNVAISPAIELQPGWYGLAYMLFGSGGTNNSFTHPNCEGFGPWGSNPGPPNSGNETSIGNLTVTGGATTWETNAPAPGDWALPSGGLTASILSGVFVRRSA